MMNEAYGTRTLREIVRILFQHWLLMGMIVLVGGAGTYAVCEYVAPRHYRSDISLIFKRPQNKSPVSADAAGDKVLEVFVKAQQQIVMSDLVLARTMVVSRDPGLREIWAELRRRWEDVREEGDGRSAAVKEEIHRFLTTGEVAAAVDEILQKKQQDLIKFRKSVKLQTPGGEQVAMTESFTIQVDRPGNTIDSHMLAHYAADILADMYIFRHQELQQAMNDPAVQVMADVVDQFQREVVEQATERYQAFVQANADKIGVLEQLMKSGTEHGIQVVLTKIRENDATLLLELARDQSIYDVLSRILPAQALEPGGIVAMSEDEVDAAIAGVSTDFFKENILFIELAKNLAVLEGKRAKIESQYMDESRDLQYIREQLGRSKRRMLEAIIAYTGGLKSSIEARKQQKQMNEALVLRTALEQNETHAKLAEYARLKNDFEVAQKHLALLQQEQIDAMSNRVFAREAVTINKLDAASVPDPDKPVIPLTGIYTAVATAVSLLLGIALAFLADHFDHTLRSSIEAERYLGVPVVGSIKRRGRRIVLPG